MTDAPVSALVVLAPAGAPPAGEPVESANLAAHLPSPETAERVRAWFTARGFETGPVVGIAFSIAAPRSRMEEVFGDWAAHVQGEELSLGALPPQLTAAIRAVTTEPPPEFGPTSP